MTWQSCLACFARSSGASAAADEPPFSAALASGSSSGKADGAPREHSAKVQGVAGVAIDAIDAGQTTWAPSGRGGELPTRVPAESSPYATPGTASSDGRGLGGLNGALLPFYSALRNSLGRHGNGSSSCIDGPPSGNQSVCTSTDMLTPLTQILMPGWPSDPFRSDNSIGSAASPLQLSAMLSEHQEALIKVLNQASRAPCNTAQGLNQLGSEMRKLQWLGQGGCGIVFKAEWKGSTVALKMSVCTGPDELEGNFREALMNKMLAHPNVVHTYLAQLIPVDQDWLDLHNHANRQTVSFTGRSGGSMLTGQRAEFVNAMLGSFSDPMGVDVAGDGESELDGPAGTAGPYGSPGSYPAPPAAAPGPHRASRTRPPLPRAVEALRVGQPEQRQLAISSPGNIALSAAATALIDRGDVAAAAAATAVGSVSAGVSLRQVRRPSGVNARARSPAGGSPLRSSGAGGNDTVVVAATALEASSAVIRVLSDAADCTAAPPDPSCGSGHSALGVADSPTAAAAGLSSNTNTSHATTIIITPPLNVIGAVGRGGSGGSTASGAVAARSSLEAGGSWNHMSHFMGGRHVGSVSSVPSGIAPPTPMSAAGGGGVGVPANTRAPRNNSFNGSLENFSVGGSFSQKRTYTFSEALHLLNVSAGQHISIIVMEHCDRGSLQRAIGKGMFSPSRRWGQGTALRSLVRTCREVAQGMAHLHAQGIVHGDLKPANVLLKSSRSDKRGFTARVADMGHSRFNSNKAGCNDDEGGGGGPASSGGSTLPLSTLVYTAPEVVAVGKVNKKSDVYTFGLMLWQMVTGKTPHADLHWGQVLAGLLDGSLTVEWPDSVPGVVRKIGSACLQHAPEERPDFDALVAALSKLEDCLRRGGARNLSKDGRAL